MAVVAKSPALIFDDFVSLLSGLGEDAPRGLAELEGKLDLHLREDLAETLGGEAALALDGPLLPTPAWKVVLEVNDPVRLQSSLETLVRRAADEASREGHPGLALEAEEVGGRTFHVLRGTPLEIHYAFANGYLVAAPSRALVMRALETRDSGETLARSESFRALFPPDRDVNVSGLVYQNLAPMVRSLLEAPGVHALNDGQRRAVEGLTDGARPSILCAYGEPSAVRVAGLGAAFDLDTSELALPVLLERVWPRIQQMATP